MQKLSAPSLQVAEAPGAAGDMAEALTGQLGEANKVARTYQNDMGADTLAKARQQAGVAQQGLSQVSRLGVSSQLAKAQAKQEVAQAKWNAAAQIGSTVVGTGMENMSQTGGFWTPGNIDLMAKSPTGAPVYKPATSWETRLNAGLGRM